MNITKKLEGDQLTIALDGRLDTATAPELTQVLKESLDGVKQLTFDMANLEYISSAGLRAILAAKKELHNKGTVTISNANAIVCEVFSVTGFDNIFEIN